MAESHPLLRAEQTQALQRMGTAGMVRDGSKTATRPTRQRIFIPCQPS